MRTKIPFVFLVSAFLSALLAPHAEAVPTVPATGLEVQITERGRISLSADGVGSNDPAGATVQVEKPNAVATVRKAFLTCAGFDRVIDDVFIDGVIMDGAISLDGNPVTWSNAVANSFFDNVFADVTAIVKPKVDAASPGIVDFTETEVDMFAVDGCGLYVIFDDPNQTTDNTLFILFGGQASAGDDFNVTLATPLAETDIAQLGLAISFSAQDQSGLGGSHLCGVESAMFSMIDVNGTRLTSCAGNLDDGQGPFGNGNLITVGGVGDVADNPSDPFQEAADGNEPRVTDDELYDLKPFLGSSDTLITARTVNPSGDDNIFAGHIFVTKPAIIDEGIVLSQSSSISPVRTPHTVTARVVNGLGQAVSGRVVDFQVISGPNAGTSNSGTTNANGEASFTYTGTGSVGTDVIVASFIDSTGNRRTSNEVQKTWVLEGEGILLTQSSSISPVGTPHTVTALVVNDLSQAVSGRVVDFQVISGPNAGTSNSGTTNANGEASFTYTGTGSVGTDVIVASFIDSTGNRRTSNEVQKTWVLEGEGIVLSQSSSISPVGTPHTVTALVVNDLSQAVSGRVVDFQVISGPNAGTSNSGTTNANGEASFTYTGTSSAGTDVIVARFIDSIGNPRRSNELQKTWVLDVLNPRGGAPLSCRGATCSIPLTCPLSPALGISCINEARVLVARRFLPRRTARSSTDTAAKAPRRMIVFASGIANIPPAATQDVPLRRTRTGKRIAQSGRRKLVGVIEIRSNAGTSISSTPVTIRIRRR